jgi:hypothetical protein
MILFQWLKSQLKQQLGQSICSSARNFEPFDLFFAVFWLFLLSLLRSRTAPQQ